MLIQLLPIYILIAAHICYIATQEDDDYDIS